MLIASCSTGSSDASSYFAVAKSQWKQAASAYAYELNFQDLEIAASLEVGLAHDANAATTTGKRTYQSAITALKDLTTTRRPTSPLGSRRLRTETYRC